MAQIANNGTGKTDWYGSFGSILEKAFTGDVFDGLNVTAQGSPNMTVKVNPGTAKISTGSTPSKQSYLVRLDTSTGSDVTITTANGSNPRRDLIVAYYDLSIVSASPNNPGALKFAAVAGTPAASPADPNATAIQTAVGASNPYIILARVTVGTSVTTITAPNITDLRTMAAPVIPDGTIKNSDLSTTQGELGGAWQSWSPSYTGISVGNGTVTARYHRTGKKIVAVYTLLFGSTTSVTAGFPTFSLPVPAATTVANHQVGYFWSDYHRPGFNHHYGQGTIASGSTGIFGAITNVAGTYASESGISGSVPWTWQSNDRIYFFIEYEAA